MTLPTPEAFEALARDLDRLVRVEPLHPEFAVAATACRIAAKVADREGLAAKLSLVFEGELPTKSNGPYWLGTADAIIAYLTGQKE